MKSIFPVLIIFSFICCSCDNSSEPETFFEASERFSDNFSVSSSIKKIVITNPIGVISLYGQYDSSSVRFVMDRNTKAKTKSLAQTELKKINLEHYNSNDTLYCNVIYPGDLNNLYECNLTLDINNTIEVEIKNQNKGIYTAYLNANLVTETQAYNTTIGQHQGSLHSSSIGGNITATIILANNETCYCISDSGDIYIKVPISTSANVHIKTNRGSISYQNLNLSVTSNSNFEIFGTLGAGGANIYLESNKGNITLEGF